MKELDLIPAYCGTCLKPQTELCIHCHNMPYCSSTCRIEDAEKHAPLCRNLQYFGADSRPSGFYSRCIFFPVDSSQPCFVWLKYYGSPQQQHIDREHLRSFVTGVPSGGDAAFDCFREGNRQLRDRIIVRHDSNALGNKQPYNQCVMALLGREAGEYWRGPLLAQSYKYHINDGLYRWTAEDRTEMNEPLIPMDLDTTSLAPILSFMRWRATTTDDYSLSIAADDATLRRTIPKTATSKKKRKVADNTPVKVEGETD
jgi:hypothetical protein